MTELPPLLTRRDVKELLDVAGLGPRRSLGQNFVTDPNTIRRIVRLARVQPDQQVVEVGPGLGSLTLGLLEAGARVVAVEKADELAASLTERLAPAVEAGRLSVVHGDALDLRWVDELDGPAPLVANLPYNVATTIVIDVLDQVPSVPRLLVMVQKEVADRMASGPGEAAYGLPSLRIARRARARRVAVIGPDVFWPRPRVDSALVEIERRPDAPELDPAEEATLVELSRAGFGQRRKTLRRALASARGTPEVVAALDAAGLPPDARAEQLDVAQWVALTRLLPGDGAAAGALP
jgi:16S rRNA (adenine1518-N6/adenine1519-N6)-dimethyltransferase